MTAEAVLAQRSAQASQAKLELFANWADRLTAMLEQPGSSYNDVKNLRNELTRWAPWAISLPIWATLHGELTPDNKKSALERLAKTRDALRSVLQGEPGAVPSDVFGDLDSEVESISIGRVQQ